MTASLASSHWTHLAHSSLGWMLGGRLVSAVLSLAILPVMLHGLGLLGYGAYTVMLALLEMAYLIFGVGLSTVAQRYWSQWWEKDELNTVRLGLVLAARAALAGLCALAVYLVWDLLSALLQVTVASALGSWYAVWLWVGSMGRQVEELMAAMLMQGVLQGIVVLANVIRLGAMIVMNLMDNLTLMHVVQLELGIGFALLVLGVAYLWKSVRRENVTVVWPSVSGARICLGFWLIQVLGQAFSWSAVRLAAGFLGGALAAGVLGSVQTILEPVRNAQPTQFLNNWLRPLMMARYQQLQSRLDDVQAKAATVALSTAVLKMAWMMVLPVLVIVIWWGPAAVSRVLGHTDDLVLFTLFLMFSLGIGAQMLRQALSWVALTLALARPGLRATAAASVILPMVLLGMGLGKSGLNWRIEPFTVSFVLAGAWALAEITWCVWMLSSLRYLQVPWPRAKAWFRGFSLAEKQALQLIFPEQLQSLFQVLLTQLKNTGSAYLHPWYQAWRLLVATASDAYSFWRGSALCHRHHTSDVDVQQARVLKTAHRIDKGLALAAPRLGFGKEAASELQAQMEHLQALAAKSWVLSPALATLRRWQLFQQQSGHAGMGNRVQTAPSTPYVQWDRALVQSWASGNFAQLVKVRRSVRQFSREPVSRVMIERAVVMAGCSPSVCNRSAARVWMVQNPELRAQLLQMQNGNAGFGEQAPILLIISVVQQAFQTVAERYQPWIDGGLFAMTLIYALHYQGLGTCCLNWSVEPEQDRRFKQAAQLPAHERIIMLLAVGNLLNQVCVAHSPRRPLSDLLQELGS